MKTLLCLCTLLVVVSTSLGLPFPYTAKGYRQTRSPHRTVMVSGYYGQPSLVNPSEYNPGSAMTAFISGENVATDSYLGGRYDPLSESEELEAPLEENTKKDIHQDHIYQDGTQTDIEEGLGNDAVQEQSTTNSKRIPKRKPVKPQQDEDEEEDEGSWPFQLGRKGPSYNAFFPIMLGGYRGSKGRDSEGYPGSATAIANSFSTGRGGVASSHATAYGDPYISTLLRNGFNFKKKQPTPTKENY